MDDFLRLALLVIAALILSFILIESWWRKRRFKIAEMNVQEFKAAESKHSINKEEDCLFNLAPSEKFAEVSSLSVDNEHSIQESISPSMQDYIAISVFAKPSTQFASYDLLQSISATGMQFGEMNIFHYYLTENGERKILFSLASATKPGEFNLDRMGDFSCVGLTLFLDLYHSPYPKMAFDKMVTVAQQLADDLEGELRAGVHTPWNDQILQQYKHRVNSIHRDPKKV